jgi:hypothetical protein
MSRYVDFIKDEKVKIYRFLSELTSSYKDIIHFDEPNTLEESIRKAKYLYEQNKGMLFLKSLGYKKKNNMD